MMEYEVKVSLFHQNSTVYIFSHCLKGSLTLRTCSNYYSIVYQTSET